MFFSNAQTISDQQKAEIEKEIDSVFIIEVKAAENLDTEKLTEGVDDRYNAGFIVNGLYFERFDSLMNNFKTRSRGVNNQHITIKSKKITVLSKNIALLTASGDTKVNVSSGNPFMVKFFWSFVYEKLNDKWKVIQSHQSNIR